MQQNQHNTDVLSNHQIKLAVLDKAFQLAITYINKDHSIARDKPFEILYGEMFSKIYKIYKLELHCAEPAVPVEKSVYDDRIYCLMDGVPVKMLKKYIQNTYGMTEEQYRRIWNLPPEYPMVAKMYSEKRRALAKKSGLGIYKTREKDATTSIRQ